jgi:hypothetical protein
MLLLDDARRCCEDAERRLTLASLGRLAQSEENLEQIGPR